MKKTISQVISLGIMLLLIVVIVSFMPDNQASTGPTSETETSDVAASDVQKTRTTRNN